MPSPSPTTPETGESTTEPRNAATTAAHAELLDTVRERVNQLADLEKVHQERLANVEGHADACAEALEKMQQAYAIARSTRGLANAALYRTRSKLVEARAQLADLEKRAEGER